MKSAVFSILLYGFILSARPVQAQGNPNLAANRPFQYGMEAKDPGTALAQAFSNTVLPVALGWGTVWLVEQPLLETSGASLAVYGLVVGPSTGNFYADDFMRGGIGVVARAAGAWLLRDATQEIFGRDFADALNVDDAPASIRDTKILIGTGLFVTSIAYNLISAGASVREYNAARGLQVRADLFRSPFTSPVPLVSAHFRF